MKSGKLIVLLLIWVQKGFAASTITWTNDVASIIYNNCSSCHHYGGIGPVSFMNYNEVVANSTSILDKVTTRQMPPWMPDPNFRHLKGEKVLSELDISKITQWINDGHPMGTGSEPTPPSFVSQSLMPVIDQTINTLNYTINSNVDVYRTFVISANNVQDLFLNAVEFLPGNNAAVHHIILFQDTSNVSRNLDISDPEPGFASNGTMQQSPYAEYVALWAPGGGIYQLPQNMGIKIPAGADFLVEVHYAPNNLGQSDMSTINIKYTSNNNVREVYVDPVMDWSYPGSMVNGPLVIPANQTKSFKQRFNNTYADFSVISVFPHMHKIGKSYKIYSTNAQNLDTTNYIFIPNWDFHWQGFYSFQSIQKFNLNDRLWGEAFFDNTVNNPDNPSSPPITVVAGEQTTEEMMITFLVYTPYILGDENIILDSTLFVSTKNIFEESNLKIFPNPSDDRIYVDNNDLNSINMNYEIIDISGSIVLSGITNVKFFDVKNLSPGIYLLRLKDKNLTAQQRFVKR